MTMTKTAARKTAARKPAKKLAAAAQVETNDFTGTARDYAHRAAEAALERATSLHTGAEKATATIETAATGSVAAIANFSREVQDALFADAKAAIVAFEKTAEAGSFGDAVRVQADYFRAQFDVNVSRAKNAAALVTEAAQYGAKLAQDNFGRLGLNLGKAA
jgi:hypothetical protein